MIRSIEELRTTSDEDLIKEHDENAKSTVVGTQYYVDELNRRSGERSQQASFDLSVATQKLARRTYWQSWISVGASIVALVISVLSLNIKIV